MIKQTKLGPDTTKKKMTWLNQNRYSLLEKYKNHYIAYNDLGIIAYGQEMQTVLEKVKDFKEPFAIYFVSRRSYSILIY